MLDCLVFTDFDIYLREFFYIQKPVCIALIGSEQQIFHRGVSINYLSNGIYDVDICSVVSKKEWDLITYRYDELSLSVVERRTGGCFINEDSFDLNSTVVKVFNVM